VSTRSRRAVTETLPRLFPLFPGFGEDASPALPLLTARAGEQIRNLVGSPEFDAWSQALARVGNCAHPVRMRGRSETVETASGAIVATYSSSQEPLGVTHVRCGNRRAEECLSCSRLYAADMFHLIRSGVAGGKGVPASVADNPLVCATLTAPSFGAVHGRRDHGQRCHPFPGRHSRCSHGRSTACHAVHFEDDPALGQPLCGDCYDYDSHVI
jgi:hypothetical protein